MSENKMIAVDQVVRIPANLIDTKMIELEVKSYAGYVTVNEDRGDQMFYWFFESREVELKREKAKQESSEFVDTTPLVIWLNGGPGGSSLTGLFMENGPYLLSNNDTGTIVKNPNSWNEEVHLLYWDQPLGTGFTYSRSNYYVPNEEELSELFLKALQEFFDIHEEYKTCPLYITGESYAGKYIPNMATAIMNCSEDQFKPNLVGLAIGDPWIKPELHLQDQIDMGYEVGFLDTKQRAYIQEEYDAFVRLLRFRPLKPDTEYWKQVVRLGNNVMEDVLACGGNPSVYDVRRWTGLSTDLLGVYLNRPSVKQAINVPSEMIWQCADDEGPVTEALIADNMTDSTGLLPDLVKHPYRMLFYDGNFDLACGYTGTEKILQDMPWDHQEAWRNLDREVWVDPPSQTIGYYKTLENLTQVLIYGAGHLVPSDQPLPSRLMLYNWIFERPFHTYLPELHDLPMEELTEPTS